MKKLTKKQKIIIAVVAIAGAILGYLKYGEGIKVSVVKADDVPVVVVVVVE